MGSWRTRTCAGTGSWLSSTRSAISAASTEGHDKCKSCFSLIFILFIGASGVLLGQTMGVHVVEYLSIYGHLSNAVSIRMRAFSNERENCHTA
ncbi:uncharacterized protein SCHCODRAFT_02195931 [Schizophyllum commune H4-8]|uniref:uncharacterized protein n=1 Tax=Schizophyllum commune (strain H4-8 / FGSC 9210) TaxID=578458 RepID=UPI0021602614|nr:uncharacterized protein SCHCODRAFT_02195931 [Schizophyllum commune H4-8]KAI5896647.1 hypothetical protein SCHCODRAFT_02195931 [Schizophyllum commune H4-8]